MRWMSFGSLRRWLPLLLPAAEAAWLVPWVLLLSGVFYPKGGLILAAGPVVGLLVGGYLLGSAPTAGRWPMLWMRLGVLASGLLLGLWAVWATHYWAVPFWHPGWVWMLLRAAHDAIPVIPPAVMAALAAPLLLWRGVVLGGREFSYFATERAFRQGVAWSAVFVVFFAIYHDAQVFALVRPVIAGYLLGFFFLSLVLLACARLLGIWEESRGKDSRPLALNRLWLVLALATSACIVLLGGALGGLAGGDIRPYVVPILRFLQLFTPLLEAVFLILFFFASLIARLILFVLSQIPMREPVTPPEAPADVLRDLLRRVRDFDLSPEVASGARWGMVLLAILILSLVILLAVVRKRRRSRAGDEDDRESVWTRGSLWRGLRRLFRRRPVRAPHPDMGGTPGALEIRRIYRRLLRAAREAGFPRRRDQTPREFQRVLGPAVIDAQELLAALTLSYESVRYGAEQPSAEQIRAARAHLRHLRERLGAGQKSDAGGPAAGDG